jgi:capsular polysaccharide biosynthesis protein
MDNVSNVSIVQPPTLPFEPIKPKKRLNLAFGIFLGIFGGIGLAFVQEFFDDTLKTNEDIEKRLELPVLATISKKDLDSCI